MHRLWPFYAGIIFALVVTLFTMPIMAGVAALMAVKGGGQSKAWLAGGSRFSVRENKGTLSVHFVNSTFTTVAVPLPGEPRPRRVLLRQEVVVPDALGRAEGRVRVDAWPLESAADLKNPPLYSMLAPGTSAAIGDDGLLWVERNGRRSAYGLASGQWMFDADGPVITFAPDVEQRRFAAVAAADDDMPARFIATIAFASQGQTLRRVMLTAEDPFRARALRATSSGMRLVTRIDETGRRVLELPLASGSVKLPVVGDDLDLAAATVPAGLKLVAFDPWKASAKR